jgi:hypothetical protein
MLFLPSNHRSLSLSLFSLSLSHTLSISLLSLAFSLAFSLNIYALYIYILYLSLSLSQSALCVAQPYKNVITPPSSLGNGVLRPPSTRFDLPRGSAALHPSGGQIRSQEGRNTPYPSLGDGVMYQIWEEIVVNLLVLLWVSSLMRFLSYYMMLLRPEDGNWFFCRDSVVKKWWTFFAWVPVIWWDPGGIDFFSIP